MFSFMTGVHTIEFQTANQLNLSALPPAYKGMGKDENRIIRPERQKRYVMNVTKLPGMQEYNSPADTQKAIEEAFALFSDMGAGYPKITRIDYRLDDYGGTYADNLSLMTVLVNLIAFEGNLYDRRVFYTDGNGTITSVRCMPHDNDHSAKYGVEYYDKPNQAKTDRYGNARLEFRRLNMEGETVQYAVKEWRDLLQSITKKEYLAMLEAHARSLYSTKQDDETATAFIRRTRSKLIAYEEWNIIHKISGKHSNHYDRAAHLSKWAEVKSFIDDLTAQLDEALNQPQTSSFHPDSVMNELPF